MKHAALSAMVFALVARSATGSPAVHLDCEALALRGPPAISLLDRESVQFQLVVTRANAESLAPIDEVELARAFADRLTELARCPVARALLPALSDGVARVEHDRLVLRVKGQDRVVPIRGEVPGRFADEAVRRLTSVGPSDPPERQGASRLAWAAWVEALLAARAGAGEDYVYADEVPAVAKCEPSLAWTRDCCRGYLRIHRFADGTADELEAALEALAAARIEDLVIDLRGNAGGLVSLGPLELLLPAGEVLALRRVFGSSQLDVLEAELGHRPFRMVVLVDARTGSMAELFAAALQAAGLAVLVGEPTHGKSVGQRTHPVGGEGLLILDAVEYFHPGTRESWSAVGLQPDHVLVPGPPPEDPEQVRLEAAQREDPGLQRALELLPPTSRSAGRDRP